MENNMNTISNGYILLAILFIMLAILLFWRLDKIWPGGTLVSLIAFGLFLLSFVIPEGDSRELSLVTGLLRITGIVGILLGFVTWLRYRGRSAASDNETKAVPKAQLNPNKCPKCGLVNRLVDSACKRCGAQLQGGE
jgi:hypothetical protein